jgi:hypothetical protein
MPFPRVLAGPIAAVAVTAMPLCAGGSQGIRPLQPGERRILTLRFPAPPQGTSRIRIQIPHLPPLQGWRFREGGNRGGRTAVLIWEEPRLVPFLVSASWR